MTISATPQTIATASRDAMEDLVRKYSKEYHMFFTSRLQSGVEGMKKAVRTGQVVTAIEKPKPVGRVRASHLDTPVLDSNGNEIQKDAEVVAPNQRVGRVVRFNRSQGRAVVRYDDDESMRMVTGRRLTLTGA